MTLNAIRFVLELIAVAVLARLIGPGNYGVFGLAWPVFAFFFAVGNSGFSTATLSQAHINESESSTLFWASAGAGLVIAALCVALSPGVAWFYSDARVGSVVAVAGLAFVINGVAVQHEALLVRAYRFRPLLIAEIVASTVAVVGSILVAVAGYGYWALVAKFLLQYGIRALMIIYATKWVPTSPQWRRSWNLLLFGRNVVLAGMLSFLVRNVDSILIGRLCGARALGFYSISGRVLLLPIQQFTDPLGKVMVPSLSRLSGQKEQYASWFNATVMMIALLLIPPMMAITAAAPDVVMVMLGKHWVEAIPVLRWLAPVGATQLVNATVNWAVLSSGRADRLLQWSLISAPTFIVSYLIGVMWGVEGVAAAVFVANMLLFLPGLWLNLRSTPIRISDFLRNLLPGMLGGMVCGTGIFALEYFGLLGVNPLTRLAIVMLLTAICVGAGALLTFGLGGARERIVGIRAALLG